MRTKLIRAIHKPPWPEVWSGMVSVAITIAILLTFLPMQVSVNTDGILSISLRQASASTSIDLQVGASSDDCYRRLTTDYWSLTQVGVPAGAYTLSYYEYGAGMRFANVTIPNGATINNAYLTFKARATNGGNECNTRISAEAADNPVTFADDKNAFDTRYGNHTTAVVDWDDEEDWTTDTEYTSPDIKTVTQEIVDREGWVSGNSIVIFWEDFDDRSDHTGIDTASACMRQAYSYDDSATYAPKLHIEYTYETPFNPCDWAKRIKLTTDNTKIDSDLTHFPITVFLESGNGDTTKVFDELSDDRFKISIADDSETPVQYYVEIEKWDEGAEEAILHFGRAATTLNSTGADSFYLYYDSTHADNTDYVADKGGRTEVWDDYFQGVWHNSGMTQVETDTDAYTNHNSITVTGMGNGNLIALWTASNGTDQMGKNIMQSISTDSGETWGTATEEWTHNASHGFWAGPAWTISNTTYFIYYAIASVDFGVDENSKLYVTKTTDYGSSWSTGSYINTGETYNIATKAIIKEQTNLGRVVAAFHYYKETNGVNRFASSTMYCDSGFDDGSNWVVSSDEMYVAIGSGTYEPSIVELSDGDLYCILRTNVTPSGVLYEATSTDDGANWTTPSSSGVTSRDTPILRRLGWSPNEVVLFANNSGSNRYPAGTRFSTDDCDTWGDFTPLYDADPTHKTVLLGQGFAHLGGNRYFITLRQYPDASEQVFWGYLTDYAPLHNGVADCTGNGNDGHPFSRDPYLLNCEDGSGLAITSNLTLECLVTVGNHDGATTLVSKDGSTTGYTWNISSMAQSLYAWNKADNVATYACTINEDTEYYLGLSDGAGTVGFFQNETKLGTNTKTSGFNSDSGNFYIGKYGTGESQYLDGVIREIRVSDTNRSDAWMKATYYSITDSLLTYGSEESVVDITNTPDTWSIGIVAVGSSSNTTIDYFTIENTGNCAVDIAIQGTNLTGGDDTWELSADASVGENIYGLMAGLDDADDLFDTVVNLTANAFVTNLAEDATQDWGLNLSMPTSLSGFDGNNMTATITLIASEHT